MNEPRFHVVSIPGCPWCSLVKQELRQRGLEFTEAKLKSEVERDLFKTMHDTKTFPQVFVVISRAVSEDGLMAMEETRLGGFEETMTWMKENGL